MRKLQDWMQWLDGVRLERWNFIRHRANLESIDLENGARLLMYFKRTNPEILEMIKARIA